MSALPQPVARTEQAMLQAPTEPSPKPRPVRAAPVISPRLLRTNQAATYLGIGEKAVRALILQGELPYVQMKAGNSPFLLDMRDLDRFIERNKFTLGKE